MKIYAVYFADPDIEMEWEGVRDIGVHAVASFIKLEGHSFFSTEALAEAAIIKKLEEDAAVEKEAGNIVEIRKIGYAEEGGVSDRWTLSIGEESEDLEPIRVGLVYEIELNQPV